MSSQINKNFSLDLDLRSVKYKDIINFIKNTEIAENYEVKDKHDEAVRMSHKWYGIRSVVPNDSLIYTMPVDDMPTDLSNIAIGAILEQMAEVETMEYDKDYVKTIDGTDYYLSVDRALIALGITKFSFDTVIEAMHIKQILEQGEIKDISKKWDRELQKMISIYAILVRKEVLAPFSDKAIVNKLLNIGDKFLPRVMKWLGLKSTKLVNEPLPENPEDFKRHMKERCKMFVDNLTWGDVKDINGFFLTTWKGHIKTLPINTYLKGFLRSQEVRKANILKA